MQMQALASEHRYDRTVSMTMTEDIAGLPLPLSGATRLYAILGDPIAQAGSPRLFNTAFRSKNAEAVLVPIHVKEDGLPALVTAFRAGLNFDGLVITVPHKFAARDMVDELGPMAQRVGAVNAIRKQADGRLLGENFDGIGFVQGLKTCGYSLSGKRVLIIGAGGAGCAVGHAVVDQGPAAVGLFDINAIRQADLVDSLRAVGRGVRILPAPPDPAAFDVVVNCTTVGMQPSDPYPIDVSSLKAEMLVVDIILKPKITALLTEAARQGCAVHEGVHMLQGQVESICDFFKIPN
jgi:shikimate dehydrogenase